MKFNTTVFWSFCANISAALGLTSILGALASIFNFEILFSIVKPFTILALFCVFPLLIIFIGVQVVRSTEELSKKEDRTKEEGSFVKRWLIDVKTPLLFLTHISKIHLVISMFLTLSGSYVYNLYPIGGINWAFNEPFLVEHAISFGTTSALFYAVMLPFYSYWSKN